jgi:hypothetical protein
MVHYIWSGNRREEIYEKNISHTDVNHMYICEKGCFIQFPLFLDVPRIDVKDDTLTYNGKEYQFIDYNLGIHYNTFSPMTQVGWTHGPYLHKMGVFTFDDDLEKNFIWMDGSTPRIGVNKDYSLIPWFECHIDKILATGISNRYLDIEAMTFDQLVDFETSIERTTSFDNSSRGHVRVTLKEYPFLSYRFSLYLVDGKYVMRVSDCSLNYTYYPIQAEYYYLFTK